MTAAIYLLILLGPGFAFCWLARVKRNQFFLAYGISFSLLVLSQVPLRLLGGTMEQWIAFMGISLGLLGMLGMKLQRKAPASSRGKLNLAELRSSTFRGVILIVGVFSVYHMAVGAYTEIPSDFWARLGQVTDQLILIELNKFDPTEKIIELVDDSFYVPLLHATVAKLIGVVPLDIVTPATLVTTLIFLISTYYFSLRIQARVRIPKKQKIVTALLTTVLTVLVYGVASFSYIRYYAYFPHILNMAFMFATIAIFLDVLERNGKKMGLLALCLIFVLVMGIVNSQEALLALLLGVTTLLWRVGRIVNQRFKGKERYIWQIGLIGLVLILSTATVVTLGYHEKAVAFRSNPHLFDLGEIISGLADWPIANPRLRFWDTLGWFGLVVYAWFFLRWRWFKQQDYVNGAMLSPLLTLFNPLFVVWFLQVAGWDPLWRLAFLMPIPFVAAYLMVRSADQIFSWNWSISASSAKVIFVTLIILIFPIQIGSFHNDTSRVPSLSSVSAHNGALVWIDVIRYLDSLEKRETLITDSVTNYVLDTATRHQGLLHPKERWQQNDDVFSGDYKDHLTYYKRDGELVIVNQRDGALSVNGRISGHWREDILKVSTLYPPKLAEFLKTNPEEFRLLWEEDGISVFRITGDERG